MTSWAACASLLSLFAPRITAATPTLSRPGIVSPIAQSVNVSLPVDVRWSAVPQAVRYEYEIYKGDTTARTALPRRATRATNFVFDTAQPGTRYLLRIRARGDRPGDTSPIVGRWSRCRFTTGVGDFGPTLLQPPDGTFKTNPQVLVGWEPVSWAARYEIEYWTATDGPRMLTAARNQTSTRIPSDPSRVNHWRVRALGNSGVRGRWSEEWTFGCIPTPPKLLWPLSPPHVVNTNTIDVVWSPGIAPLGQELEVYAGTDSSSEALVDVSLDASAASYRLPIRLDTLSNYFWQMRSVAAEAPSVFATNSIHTGVWSPEVQWPKDGTELSNRDYVQIQWEQLNGVTAAQVEFQNGIGATGQKFFPRQPTTGNTAGVSGLRPGTYTFRVNVRFKNGEVRSSPWITFKIRDGGI